MTDQRPENVYSQHDNPAHVAWMATRTADKEAQFFLSYLRPSMSLLDVGCGPGTITLGLARAVAPGEVLGIDLQATQVEQARSLAAERGVANVRFEVGDAYRLPFPDCSFDAVFANAVFVHLREPIRALGEIRRVLRAGGVVGVRDPGVDGDIFTPATPLQKERDALVARINEHNGRNPFVGRHHRRLLLDAGFAQTKTGASIESAGSVEETRCCAAYLKERFRGMARTALSEGWVTPAAVDAMADEFDAWAERPDAFRTATWCETVGWKHD